MADAVLPLNLFLELAVAVLTLVAAAFVHFVPPRSGPKTLLALFLAFMGARSFRAFDLLSEPVAPGDLSAWTRYILDLNTLGLLTFAAFLWVYPARVRLRSWHAAAVGSLALAMAAGGVAWLLDKGLLFDPAPGEGFPGSLRTVLFQLTWGFGGSLALGAAVASGLWRARGLAEGTRRTAFLLLPLLALSPFVGLGGFAFLAPQGLLSGSAVVPAAASGDCCGVTVLLWALQGLAFVGMAAGLAWRGRSWAAAGLLAYGFGLQAAFSFATAPVNTFALTLVLRALAPLYVISRHGAFGARSPPWGHKLVAGVVLLVVFLQVNALVAGAFGATPLALPAGVLLGLALGAAAALAVLPEGATLLGLRPAEPPGSAERRLAPYRAALQAELAGGAAPEAAADKLRGLRAELGVSELEHVALAVGLQPASGPARGASLAPGELFLGRYRVQRVLGEGGFGATRLCRDELVRRDVVIKSIRSPAGRSEGLEAVLREARAIGALQHPNVVALHDVVQVGDEAFIVMEHVEGGSLGERVLLGPLDGEAFARLAGGTLAALEAVHAAGMVHRDVKPSNILLTRGGEAKLADFGVAHLRGFEATAGATGDGTSAVGTIRFMSPEQAKGRQATPRSDLFSAAATLYEAYTGRPYLAPRRGETPMELQIRAAKAGRFAAPVGEPALDAWFARALEPDPAARFAGAREMREALRRAVGGP